MSTKQKKITKKLLPCKNLIKTKFHGNSPIHFNLLSTLFTPFNTIFFVTNYEPLELCPKTKQKFPAKNWCVFTEEISPFLQAMIMINFQNVNAFIHFLKLKSGRGGRGGREGRGRGNGEEQFIFF